VTGLGELPLVETIDDDFAALWQRVIELDPLLESPD
jgi:hypothetical protein